MKHFRRYSTLLGLLISLSLHAQDHQQHHPPPATEGGKSPPLEQARQDDHAASMRGFYGAYSMSREASGTSWQPEATPIQGVHGSSGPWSTMWHGYINAIYDRQGGPRGDNKTFSQSMLMGMAQRSFAGGTLGVRGMISLDPLMGKSGYPLLFQTGETADGQTHLIDRQHPHDLLMELALTYSRPLSDDSSTFVYVGLPGEPALGPTAFMHRHSALDNPEAPLTHHWLDSTHITFGVVTLGYIWRGLKLEGSVFNGREPDQYRYNIETRKLDSASARLTWNPSPDWSMQISHGKLKSPEGLEPDVSIKRTTASVSHQYQFGSNNLQSTLAWGRNRKQPGGSTDGWLFESALRVGEKYTFFGRVERVENGELFQEDEPLHGQVFKVGKLSLGGVYDFARFKHTKIGVGALVSRYAVPDALRSVYGKDPTSFMVFVRAKFE
jgi:hypothetical protein